jgi:hypothetical protein
MDETKQNPKPTGKVRRLGALVGEFAEPAAAFLGGLVLGVLGVVGILKGDKLTAATLFVLSALGISLVRERSLRVKANRNIEGLGRRLDQTRDAVNAIHSGNPYTVLLHETTWDIVEPDGSLVHVARTKKIRFDQNGVAALYDVATGDGERESEYSPGEAVKDFLAEGRRMSLIALGRVYYRGDKLKFKVKRISRNAFLNPHELVTVQTRDATTRMRLRIIWPATRKPTAVRLGRATPTQEWRNEDVLQDVKTENSRAVYMVEILNPERGGSHTIEWEW